MLFRSFHLPRADKMPHGDSVLVKPYHEAVDNRAKYWQKHLIQGWAEMSNQNLWHAAGMGHIHQRVHLAEHNMGPGWEKHPAVVIHAHPEANFVSDMHPRDYDDTMHDDAPKIAAMDFLTNNLDRHPHNLMVLPEMATEEDGSPVSSRLLAIDHGRSFQYQASHKGIPEFYEDEVYGKQPVDPEFRARKNKEGKEKDSLLNYLESSDMGALDSYGELQGVPSVASPHGFMPGFTDWWPGVRHSVVASMMKIGRAHV